MTRSILCTAALAAALGALPARAQAPAAAPVPPGLAVGTTAPDITLPGTTRSGSRAAPGKLSAFRGQTVVIAFFYKARTKG